MLTTEVINWARGAVREAVLAAQLMHYAEQEGTPPKHVDGRLLTIKDEEFRPYTEAELRELHASITDPNVRIFTDADWIYAFNAEHFVKGTDINQIFDELGVDEHTHAFYLGKELMKASIARGLGKNYRQESPLDWGYLTFDEPRRERVRLTARSREAIRRGGIVKKVLLQLDTEEHPSPFDAIVAHDAGVDVLLSHGGVKAESARALAQDAFFTRGPDDLNTMAVWVGGKDVAAGEEIFAAGAEGVLRPLPGLRDARLERLQHDRGHDDRADREGARPLGLTARSCSAWAPSACGRPCCCSRRAARSRWPRSRPTCSATIAPIAARAASAAAQRLDLDVREPADRGELEALLEGAQIVLSAGPAGVPVLRRDFWSQHPTIELLADYNAAEPLGIEGTKATDDMADYDGKLVLGALAIGGPKMKVHKTCVRRLFESNDQMLDTDAVYAIAKELV